MLMKETTKEMLCSWETLVLEETKEGLVCVQIHSEEGSVSPLMCCEAKKLVLLEQDVAQEEEQKGQEEEALKALMLSVCG